MCSEVVFEGFVEGWVWAVKRQRRYLRWFEERADYGLLEVRRRDEKVRKREVKKLNLFFI